MKRTAILSATLLIVAATAQAEDSPVDVLQKRIDALEKKLSQALEELPVKEDVQGIQSNLEGYKYEQQRLRETKTATSTRNLVIGGLVQARAGWVSKDTSVLGDNGTETVEVGNPAGSVSNNPAVVSDRRTTFDLGAAQVSFLGNLYRDYAEGRNLTFALRLGTSPQTGTNNSFANLLDANITYSLLPTIDPAEGRLTVTFGQQTLPFGLEVNTTEELRPVINNAQFVAASGLGARQIGLIIRGDAFVSYDYGYNYRSSLISYNLGIVNGSGPNRADDNSDKDYIGRVDFKIPTDYNSWLRELRLGVSAYYGKALLSSTVAGPPVVVTINDDSARRERYGVDVYYNHWPIGVTFEAVRLVDEVATSATTTAIRRGDAYTATAFYSFGEQFLNFKNQGRFDDWWPKTYQPFFRYDRLDPDRSESTNAGTGVVNTPASRTAQGLNPVDIYTLGFNIFFAETTKFQLNVSQRVDHRSQGGDYKTYEGLAQLQFGF